MAMFSGILASLVSVKFSYDLSSVSDRETESEQLMFLNGHVMPELSREIKRVTQKGVS